MRLQLGWLVSTINSVTSKYLQEKAAVSGSRKATSDDQWVEGAQYNVAFHLSDMILLTGWGGGIGWVILQCKLQRVAVPHAQDPDERGGQFGGHPAHDTAAAEAGEQAGGQAGQEVHELHQPPLRLGRQQHQRALQRICRHTHSQKLNTQTAAIPNTSTASAPHAMHHHYPSSFLAILI